MKRLFALMLAAALVLSLAVCCGIGNTADGENGVWEEILSLRAELPAAAGQVLRPLLDQMLAALERALNHLGMGHMERRLAFLVPAVPLPLIPWHSQPT